MRKILFQVSVIGFALVLIGAMLSCSDSSGWLLVRNSMLTGIRVEYREISVDGTTLNLYQSEAIPSGATGRVRIGVTKDLPAIPSINLVAKDESGMVVWQRSWTGEEFAKLGDDGWVTTIAP